MNERLDDILNNLKIGNNIITYQDITDMNRICTMFLNNQFNNYEIIQKILIISNTLYDNTSNQVLPLEDGVYDLVINKYNIDMNNTAPVGSVPVSIKDKEFTDIATPSCKEDEDGLISPIQIVNLPSNIFVKDILKNNKFDIKDYEIHNYDEVPVNNNIKNISHNYPELVGTLHKCKFVDMGEAREKGISEENTSVRIFDRDFLLPLWNSVRDSNDKAELIVELKYDGVSVEATVQGDTIISAVSRGDTENDIATDLTPIFGGYKFHRATGRVDSNLTFGIKFEAIITHGNLRRLQELHKIVYKNNRVAVVGLMGRKDARKFRDFITLVPIKSSGLVFNHIKEEIDFLNTYYSSGVYMRYSIIYGKFTELVYLIKHFKEEAEYMRDAMDFLYDGIVVSFTDPRIIQLLGRSFSKDNWSIAIKFNASAKTTYFRGYSYSIGQDGRVTPMAHFMPVEFFGTIHDKTTAHSYRRFKQLNLREGDIVTISYVNDVICYITKPDISYNSIRAKNIPPIEFPTHCPYCGMPLKFSETDGTAWCVNIRCPERTIAKVANMLQKLNIKDFGRSLLRKLNIHNLSELLDIDINAAAPVIGDGMAEKLAERILEIKSTLWKDYIIIGSIGFSSISQSRWKLILNKIPYQKLCTIDDASLSVLLHEVKGIGSKIVNTILNEREFLKDDLLTVINRLNVESTYGVNTNLPQIRFSGLRNYELESALKELGYDADGEKNVTKTTSVLVIPYEGYVSNKVNKALTYGVRLMTEQQIIDMINSKRNVHL